MQSSSTSPKAPPAASFFRGYQPRSGTFDEVFTGTGEVRAHWSRIVQDLMQIGADEFARRWDHSRLLVHENGIAYSAFGDPSEYARPWELDPFPLLIAHDEWAQVECGLKQRAELMNLILADLYGPQTLITDGILPPEILFLHPGFRRPYHGIPVPHDRWLQNHAVDLARGADGRWWVLADRTEAPSGVGFALENRIVLSRMLPSCFRQANASRLASYFMRMQESMRRLAPRQRDNPRIVLLSQGTSSANYFEDAYLARYLGYTLVEGDDLAVRCNEVMVKTLSGLLPVDVILRRPNSEACDSLELDGHFNHGSPGLLEAVRASNVGIANTMGSGLVESPVFLAFLPTLALHLLKEPLALPGVATWWCGRPDHWDHVVRHFDSLIIKPAFRRRGTDMLRSRELGQMSRTELLRRVQASPKEYVAQERIARSTMPRWSKGEFDSVYVSLRAFVSASDDQYHVLPGGLTRTSKTNDVLDVRLSGSEGSKDTWILSNTPVEQVSLLPTTGESLRLERSRGDLPSRVADNLYWLGRHLERADSNARLLRTVAIRITSEAGSARFVDLPYLLRCLAEHGQIEPGFAIEGIKDQMPTIELGLPAAVFDPAQPSSLRSIVESTYHIASRVRDRLSVDSWRAVAHLDANFRRLAGTTPDLSDLLNVANELIIDLAAFGGLVTESMTRTHAYRFVELGRRLERSLQILTLVNACFLGLAQVPYELLESVLEIADSRMTYRSRYLATLQIHTVLDLLLTDDTNPRALAYQLVALKDHVLGLPRLSSAPGLTPDQRLVTEMLHTIHMADIEAIVDAYVIGDQSPLQALIDTLLAQLPQLSNAVSMRYLVHAGPSQLLGDLAPSRGIIVP